MCSESYWGQATRGRGAPSMKVLRESESVRGHCTKLRKCSVTPRCRRCQSVGISAKESCIQGAEVAQDEGEIYVAGSKAKGAVPSESSSTLDRELNSWVPATLDFSLALVQYLCTIFPFPLI